MKKTFLLILSLALAFVLSSCSGRGYREMSEAEIKAMLSDVVASQHSIHEAGLRYFSGLSSDNNNIIQAADLQKRIDSGENLFILDIRREADYLAGHVPTAQNIWWFDIGRQIDRLPKDRPIVAYCYSGQSAGQVIGVLQVMGYDARSLAGGMNNGWLPAKLPLASGR